jgi:hypothetical protein
VTWPAICTTWPALQVPTVFPCGSWASFSSGLSCARRRLSVVRSFSNAVLRITRPLLKCRPADGYGLACAGSTDASRRERAVVSCTIPWITICSAAAYAFCSNCTITNISTTANRLLAQPGWGQPGTERGKVQQFLCTPDAAVWTCCLPVQLEVWLQRGRVCLGLCVQLLHAAKLSVQNLLCRGEVEGRSRQQALFSGGRGRASSAQSTRCVMRPTCVQLGASMVAQCLHHLFIRLGAEQALQHPPDGLIMGAPKFKTVILRLLRIGVNWMGKQGVHHGSVCHASLDPRCRAPKAPLWEALIHRAMKHSSKRWGG